METTWWEYGDSLYYSLCICVFENFHIEKLFLKKINMWKQPSRDDWAGFLFVFKQTFKSFFFVVINKLGSKTYGDKLKPT